jgi:hypothetical protein
MGWFVFFNIIPFALFIYFLDLPKYIGSYPRQTRYPEKSLIMWNAITVVDEIAKFISNFLNGVTKNNSILLNSANYQCINYKGRKSNFTSSISIIIYK